MVQLTPPPAGVQDRLVYDYLYQLQEYLSGVLSALRPAAREAERQARKASGEELGRQVQSLKALIVKTADEVEAHTAVDLSRLRALVDRLGDVVEGEAGLQVQLLAIRSDYVARSEFGAYSQQTAQQWEAAADALTQHVAYTGELRANVEAVSAAFNAWRVESEGYIRSGVVGWREDESPIIGIAIGQNLTVLQDADGNDVTETVTDPATGAAHCYKVVEQKGFRAVYAADELSFWQDDVKVACMSNNQLTITDVVALSRLTVGRWDVADAADGLVIRWRG